jgi:hypothetical protein
MSVCYFKVYLIYNINIRIGISAVDMKSLQVKPKRGKTAAERSAKCRFALRNDREARGVVFAQKLCQKLKFKIIHNKLNVIYPKVLPTVPTPLLSTRTQTTSN